MFAILKWLIVIGFTLLLAGFSVVNRHLIVLEFYPMPFEMELPVYLLMLIMFFGGFLLAWLLDRFNFIKLSHRAHRAEQRSHALEEEVARLRHQPSLPADQ